MLLSAHLCLPWVASDQSSWCDPDPDQRCGHVHGVQLQKWHHHAMSRVQKDLELDLD